MSETYSIPFRFRLSRPLIKGLFRTIFHILGHVEIIGEENIPLGKPYVVAMNHISIFAAGLILVLGLLAENSSKVLSRSIDSALETRMSVLINPKEAKLCPSEAQIDSGPLVCIKSIKFHTGRGWINGCDEEPVFRGQRYYKIGLRCELLHLDLELPLIEFSLLR